jgi:hypothetical protein
MPERVPPDGTEARGFGASFDARLAFLTERLAQANDPPAVLTESLECLRIQGHPPVCLGRQYVGSRGRMGLWRAVQLRADCQRATYPTDWTARRYRDPPRPRHAHPDHSGGPPGLCWFPTAGLSCRLRPLPSSRVLVEHHSHRDWAGRTRGSDDQICEAWSKVVTRAVLMETVIKPGVVPLLPVIDSQSVP